MVNLKVNHDYVEDIPGFAARAFAEVMNVATARKTPVRESLNIILRGRKRSTWELGRCQSSVEHTKFLYSTPVYGAS